MRGNISITLFVIFLLILLGVGFGLGYFFGRKGVKVEPQVCPPSLLDSKILFNWMAFAKGEVKEISNRTLILSSDGETLKISIPEGVKIQALNGETNKMEEANFEDIKIGNKVEIQLLVIPKEKLLIGSLITILP